MLSFSIDTSTCIQCGECVADCPAGIITMNGYPEITRQDKCFRCQHCYAVCPTGALSLLGLRAQDAPTITPALPTGEQLAHLVSTRRSIRRYRDENLPQKLINSLLQAACHAPTGINAQTVHFTVVRDKDFMNTFRQTMMNRLCAAADADALPQGLSGQYLGWVVKEWKTSGRDVALRSAPHLLLTSAPAGTACPLQDTHIALTTFELLAAANGVGTLWDGILMMALGVCPDLRTMLNIPADHTLGYAMIFGWPAVSYHRPVRRGPASINWLG